MADPGHRRGLPHRPGRAAAAGGRADRGRSPAPGPDNYENLAGRHADAQLHRQRHPGGHVSRQRGLMAADLPPVPAAARAALDVIYNPLRTALLLQAASAMGIAGSRGALHAGGPGPGGRPSSFWAGHPWTSSSIRGPSAGIWRGSCENIVLVGMPGSRQEASVGALAGPAAGPPLSRPGQPWLRQQAGMAIPRSLPGRAKEAFRRLEAPGHGRRPAPAHRRTSSPPAAARVLRPENREAMRHQNGSVVWLQRDLAAAAHRRPSPSPQAGRRPLGSSAPCSGPPPTTGRLRRLRHLTTAARLEETPPH